MSIMGMDNFAGSRYMEVRPEWVKSERYDYCEGFDEYMSGRTAAGSDKKDFFNIFSKKLFSFFL